MHHSSGTHHEVVAHALSSAGVEKVCGVDQRRFQPGVRQLPHMQLQVQLRRASGDLGGEQCFSAVPSLAGSLCQSMATLRSAVTAKAELKAA